MSASSSIYVNTVASSFLLPISLAFDVP